MCRLGKSSSRLRSSPDCIEMPIHALRRGRQEERCISKAQPHVHICSSLSMLHTRPSSSTFTSANEGML
jgi:hypothetical protein